MGESGRSGERGRRDCVRETDHRYVRRRQRRCLVYSKRGADIFFYISSYIFARCLDNLKREFSVVVVVASFLI